jgi:general stress protein CsbA
VRLGPLLVLSVAVAVLGAVLPFAAQYEPGLTRSWIASVCLVLFWLILVVVGLVKFKKRGLWLLIGAPIALFFPFALVTMFWACAHNRFACP